LHLDLTSQSSEFNAGLLVNANGIHIRGQNISYWNGSEGEVWGTGGMSLGGFVKRDFSDYFYVSLELRVYSKRKQSKSFWFYMG